MNEIVMSYEKILPDGQGSLKPNERGEYRVRLGAVNVFNASGIFYKDGIDRYSLEKAIKNDGKEGRPMSMLNQQMQKNSLFGEAGHPIWKPGMDEDKFFERNLFVDPQCVAFSIRKLYWVPTNINVDKLGIGGNLVYIEADIKPFGPYKDALIGALESEVENVAFSIRSLVDFKIINGVKVRILQDIITWDWVILPGIPMANKIDFVMDKLGVESLQYNLTDSRSITFTKESVERTLQRVKEGKSTLSTESSHTEIVTNICENILHKPKYESIIIW